jgi:hypothetical protein
VAFSFCAFFCPRPGVLDPALDGGLVALPRAARRLLPAPAEAVQQAADMIAAVAHPEASPDQIGHPLRGPQGRRKAVGFGPLDQQARQLREPRAGQLVRAPGTRTTAQRGISTPLPPPLPDEYGLATDAQPPGNRGKRA